MRPVPKGHVVSFKFQSAPDREVGRCHWPAHLTMPQDLFQSAPDREVGRCAMARAREARLATVSIRARP